MKKLHQSRIMLGVLCFLLLFFSCVQTVAAKNIENTQTEIESRFENDDLTDENNEKEITPREPITASAIASAALAGATKAGVTYGVKCVQSEIFGGDVEFSCEELSSRLLIGAVDGVTFLLLPLPDWVLDNIFFGHCVSEIENYLIEKLQPVFETPCDYIEDNTHLLTGGIINFLDTIRSETEAVLNQDAQTLAEHMGDQGFNANLPVWVDFEPSIATSGITISHNNNDEFFCWNDLYKTWTMNVPGGSFVEGEFNLSSVPSEAYLTLTHLTSAVEGAYNGGYSPIDVYINGTLFLNNFDVGERHENHGWNTDHWAIAHYLKTGTNTVRIELVNIPEAASKYWIRYMSIQEGRYENRAPFLFNPSVTPSSGTTSTSFEFLVDYYDLDGDSPVVNKDIHIDGNTYTMYLKSGEPSDGTYAYQTNLPSGTHSYYFHFTENNGGSYLTPSYSGPSVFTTDNSIEISVDVDNGPVTNNIKVRFGHGPDLQNVEYQEWFAPELPVTLGISSGERLFFSILPESDDHTFTRWVFTDDDGNIVNENPSSGYGWTMPYENIHATAHFSYEPNNYTISGTVLRDDGLPVPEGVDLTVSSSEQTLTYHASDGNFSFTNVWGGVPVTVTPSATGYAFTPSCLSYGNLHQDHTGENFIAFSSDAYVPITSFLSNPPPASGNSSISFSWIGQDDITSTNNLLYQYKLDCFDHDWSNWVANTSAEYNLPNGAYTFWVRAMDEAGNVNQAPIKYTFVVNAAPRLISALRTNKSVWASKITLEMPYDAGVPGNSFILLPEHSGTSDTELVPVKIYRDGETTPCGANELVSDVLGLPVMITKAETGWMFILPESLSSGQSAQYDIVWGKIKYFGWQDYVSVPVGFPNGGAIQDSYLSDDFKLWRIAVKKDGHGTGFVFDDDNWIFMNIGDRKGIVQDEKILRFVRGEDWGDDTGTRTEFDRSSILKDGSDICFLWCDNKYEWDGSNYCNYRRYGLNLFNSLGFTLNSADGIYEERAWIKLPSQLIHNKIWVIGDQSLGGSSNSQNQAWFLALDVDGNQIIPRTLFDNFQNDNGGDLSAENVLPLGENVLLLWEREWGTDNDCDRQEIVYQLCSPNGTLIELSTVVLNPPLSDDWIEKDDEFSFSGNVVDNNGKAWISFERHQEENGIHTWDHYYVILDPDGNIWKGPIQTSSWRNFRFCDKDNYIWATEDGQFFALNADDTIAVGPIPNTWIPTQEVGNIAASVSGDGYRLYDRWSPQFVSLNLPLGANPTSMELFDLNLWDNDLHPANINITKDETQVWSQSGQFTGYTTVDLSGIINEEASVLTMTQNNFMGGQILVTFPYSPDSDGDGVPDSQDQCPDTPLGESVYEDGCSASQRDFDGDGVSDDIDLCPFTPAGADVDANGCSASEKDSDDDGVTDDLDLCPNTPAGESVDANGCSDSQRDTDGDGVTDDLDQCPDTPAGESVDADGCSASQFDSDGDGVTDDLDQCPDTPAGTEVDEFGCPFYIDTDGNFTISWAPISGAIQYILQRATQPDFSDAITVYTGSLEPLEEIAMSNGTYYYRVRSDNDTTWRYVGTVTVALSPSVCINIESLEISCPWKINAEDQSFEIWNCGGGTLNYSISDDADWLVCNPENGSSTGGHDSITLQFSTAELDEGPYEANITIGDPSPNITIPVNLTITRVAPIADAGDNQDIDETQTEPVCLNGSNSSDPDGHIVSFNWEQTDGSIVELSDPTDSMPTFAVPDVPPGGESLSFMLTVTDNSGLEDQDSCIVNILANTNAPTADAGDDQEVYESDIVTLDGSNSYDSDGEVVSYEWEQVDIIDTIITLSDPNDMTPTFTAPDVYLEGETLTFLLTVTDNDGLIDDDTCIVNVLATNIPPTANAGDDQRVEEGTTITLDGSLSEDIDGQIVSYVWKQTDGPQVTLSDITAVQPTFVAPIIPPGETTLTFELTVEDNEGLKSNDEVEIRVWDNAISGFPEDVITFHCYSSEYPEDRQRVGIKVISGGSLITLCTVDPKSNTSSSHRPDKFLYDLLDFCIKLESPAQSAEATVYFPAEIPSGYQWYKYNNQTMKWSNYNQYVEFNEDRTQLTITLVDGGIGDADGIVNGCINDPSGFGKMVKDDNGGGDGGGGGGGCFINTSTTDPTIILILLVSIVLIGIAEFRRKSTK